MYPNKFVAQDVDAPAKRLADDLLTASTSVFVAVILLRN